jgi:hypothetical protein
MPLLAGFGMLLSASVAWPCGLGDPTVPVKLPCNIARSVIRGNLVHAISTDGRLFTVDLLKGNVRDNDHSYPRLAPMIDVAGDLACVSSGTGVHVIDLKSGKMLHTRKSAALVEHAGFISDQRVWIIAGAKLTIVDMAGDSVLHTIDLGKAPREAARAAVIGEGASRHLLVPMGAEKAVLAVIDPEKGEVIDRIPLPGMSMGGIHAAGDVQVVGDKAYVVCWRFSYGVWTESIGCVDLKERTFTALKRPSALMQGRHLVIGAGGKVFLAGSDGAAEYNADGKLAGSVFSKGEGELVGVWRGYAVVVKDKELRRPELPTATAKAD